VGAPTCSHVWYAAYGSNMAAVGLASYLEGTTPPGGTRRRPGARDRTPPAADVAVELPHRLRFAGASRAWDHFGVAYLERDHSHEPTLARAWLLTTGQFEDIVAQESHRAVSSDPPTTPVDLDALLEQGRARVDDGHYDEVLLVGKRDGYPIATCTTPDPPAPAAPSPAYLTLVATGLAEGWGLDPETITRYLMAQTGVAEGWSADDVQRTISAALPVPAQGSGNDSPSI